jgi:MFS family permease
VAILFFVNGVVVGSWLPRLPEIRDRLGIDLRTLGLILALGGVGSLIGSSLSGVVVTRLGARRAAVISASALFVMLPLVSVAPTAAYLAVVLALMGLVDSPSDVGMNAVGIRVEERLGRSIMNRLHGLWSLGTLIGSGGSALAILVGLALGPQLLMVAVVGLAAVLVAGRLVPDTAPRVRTGARSGTLALGLMLAGGTLVFIEGAPFDWSAIYLLDNIGTGPAVASTGVILFTAGMLAGRLGGDHVVDRFGSLPTLFAGVALSLVAMLAVVTADATATALVGFGTWGLGISVAVPVLYKLAGSHRSFGEGSGLAALTVGTRLGFLVAPAVIGAGAAAWGLPTALGVIVGVAGVASMMAVRLALGTSGPVDDSLPDTGV